MASIKAASWRAGVRIGFMSSFRSEQAAIFCSCQLISNGNALGSLLRALRYRGGILFIGFAMSTTAEIIDVLKAELKLARLTYADLGRELGLAESSVKRMFAKGDMPLKRIDEICRVLKCDFAEIARKVADKELLRDELSAEQEQAVVADRGLLVVALCTLSQWPFEQILATYEFTELEALRHLLQLDRLGVIELKPLNRYRLKLSKTFRWRANGPVMQFFRDNVVADYFSGGFDGDGEILSLVHGRISLPMAKVFQERLQRLAQDFAQQHLADLRLPAAHKRGFTAVLGLRSGTFGPLRDLLRDPASEP
jgi:DNA-binding Xre family transcriptional regulator